MLENTEASINILIIDDETLILEIVREYLKEIPCSVYEAQTKEEAWSIFTKEKIDLVIADVRLSKKESGLDLAEDILKANYSIPIILLTGHDDKEIILQALRIGVVDYLTKPMERTFFLARVNEAILKRKVHLAQEKIIETLHELLHIPQEKMLFRMSIKERIIYIQELVTIAAIKKERDW